jgi:hypothetical protein
VVFCLGGVLEAACLNPSFLATIFFSKQFLLRLLMNLFAHSKLRDHQLMRRAELFFFTKKKKRASLHDIMTHRLGTHALEGKHCTIWDEVSLVDGCYVVKLKSYSCAINIIGFLGIATLN